MAKPIFQATYRYRNVPYFLNGLLFASAGIAIPTVITLSFALRSPEAQGPGVAGAIVLPALALLFLWVGIKLGKRILGRCYRDAKLEVIVGRTGIHIGEAHYPWQVVDWVGGRRCWSIAPKYHLAFGYSSFANWIPTNHALDEEAFRNFLKELEGIGATIGPVIGPHRNLWVPFW